MVQQAEADENSTPGSKQEEEKGEEERRWCSRWW
jgi:hypothetical protein